MFDPEFNETFVFQIIEFDLPSVSLMFSIMNIKKMRRKEIVGWFFIGQHRRRGIDSREGNIGGKRQTSSEVARSERSQ